MKLKIPFQMKDMKKIEKKHLLTVGLVGVLLLVISFPVEEKKEKVDSSKDIVNKEQGPESREVDEYRKDMEKQLERILGAMEGVGKVEVMITMKDEGEMVLEKDLTQTEEKTKEEDGQGIKRENSVINFQEETIYIQDDSANNTPFITKEVTPKVEGVLIVAQGGNNAVTVKNISEAVLALFPVEVHKIKVVKMSES